MVRIYQENQRVARLLIHLFCLVALLVGVVFHVRAEESAVTVSVRREGETVFGVYLSENLFALTEGEPAAVLITVRLSPDLSLDRIEAGEGARGMRLTVGECVELDSPDDLYNREMSVLLDGRAEASDAEVNEPILRIYVKGYRETEVDSGGFVGVTGGKYGDAALYLLGKDGEVVTVPLYFHQNETFGSTETDGIPDSGGDSRPSEPIPELTDTDTESAAETHAESLREVTESATEPCEETQIALNRFMGCRETTPREGKYTVQFLFYGEGRDTPVVCFGRGETLCLEVSYGKALEGGDRADETGGGSWSFCVFRGLDAGERYEFWVYTEEGRISVIYDRGSFQDFFS